MGISAIDLQTEKLSMQFGGLKAVNNVDLQLYRGEIRALIGPNGAGKSTLFNLIAGVYKPTAGQIFFLRKNITRLPAYRRVKLGMGRSFQIVNIFPELSVIKNVEIAVQAFFKRKNHPFEFVDKKRVTKQVEYIFGKFDWFEDPYLMAGRLIYAEQKKLETILAIANEPQLVLLDEPTAGIDEDDIISIIEMIKEIADGRTVLITDHDIKFVMKIADRISVMDQGSIIVTDSPAEIADNPRVNEIYFGGTV